jgi:hypothetical protein
MDILISTVAVVLVLLIVLVSIPSKKKKQESSEFKTNFLLANAAVDIPVETIFKLGVLSEIKELAYVETHMGEDGIEYLRLSSNAFLYILSKEIIKLKKAQPKG